MLLFENNIVMITENKENLERILQKMNKTFIEEYNIDKSKTKILVCGGQQIDTNITIDCITLINIS